MARLDHDQLRDPFYLVALAAGSIGAVLMVAATVVPTNQFDAIFGSAVAVLSIAFVAFCVNVVRRARRASSPE